MTTGNLELAMPLARFEREIASATTEIGWRYKFDEVEHTDEEKACFSLLPQRRFEKVL